MIRNIIGRSTFPLLVMRRATGYHSLRQWVYRGNPTFERSRIRLNPADVAICEVVSYGGFEQFVINRSPIGRPQLPFSN